MSTFKLPAGDVVEEHKLALRCVGMCDLVVMLPLPLPSTMGKLALVLNQQFGWYLSTGTTEGTGERYFSVLCPSCAVMVRQSTTTGATS